MLIRTILLFILIVLGLSYAVLFLYGLFYIIFAVKDKKALMEYLIFSPGLIWIIPIAAFRVLYKIMSGKREEEIEEEWQEVKQTP